MNEPTRLFSTYNLRDIFEQKRREIVTEINEFEPDYVSIVSIDECIAYFQKKHTLPVPIIDESNITRELKEATKFVGHSYSGEPARLIGSEFFFYIPFEGEEDLFLCRPSSFGLNTPEAIVEPGELTISYFREYAGHEGAEKEAAAVRRGLDNDLNTIKQYLSQIVKDVTAFEKTIKDIVAPQLDFRKKKYAKEETMSNALGYPLRRSDNAPAPIMRKSLPVSRPKTAKNSSYSFLAMEEYEHILSILNNMALVMERSPKAFSLLKEEDLRWHFLFQLNGHYEGAASGETFNFDGKTDILIRHEGKNIFIAECKFWQGQQGLLDTINQLLGYISWRDTKTAILLFNKERNLSTLLKKIPDTVKSHPNYKRDLSYDSETGFRYVFHHRDDNARELILTVLVFEVPQKREE